MTEQDQNVLLKIVEEGPPYAAFLFCAENSAVVLQTLRSRCVELKLHPAQERAAPSPRRRRSFAGVWAAAGGGPSRSWRCVWSGRKPAGRIWAALLERSRAAFSAALLLLYGQQPDPIDREIAPFLAKNLTKTQIMRTIELLQKYHGECVYNVGPSHVLGALAVELEGTLDRSHQRPLSGRM